MISSLLRRLTPRRPARHSRRQRGAAILAFALIGLTGATVLALPVLARATNDLHTETVTAARLGNGATSAAEHALWRIENDSAFLASMTGQPPTAGYTLELPGGTTTVTVTSTAANPNPDPVDVILSVEPSVVDPDTPTTVTFTLTAVNNDVVARTVTRADAVPLFWNPGYVNGSTTGFTTGDPSQGFFGWRWNVSPSASVPPFGGSASMRWQMTVDESSGTWWTSASLRVEGIGNVYAPLTARVRFMTLDDADITTAVTPAEVTAGPSNTFQYTLTLLNTGAAPLTVEWIDHYTATDFDYVAGSSSGVTGSNPAIWYDWITGRRVHRWTLPNVPLEPLVPLTLTFQMTAVLDPGVHYSRSAFKVAEDGGFFGLLPTFDTGETAPITAIRAYRINAAQGTRTVDVEALLGSTGVDVVSWEAG